MAFLIAGVALWSVVHLYPAILPGNRTRLVDKLGANAYRGLFSLDIVIALVLVIVGWRMADVRPVYAPPLYGSPVVTGLMFISFLLFAGASAPGNIKRVLRHPMLLGMLTWSVAHLLANGDNRSIVLFGGLGLWSIASIVLINRRDGGWQRPAAVPASKDAMTIVATLLIFGLATYLHRFVIGVSALPGFQNP